MFSFSKAQLILSLAFLILENVPNHYFVHAIFDGIEARMGEVPWQVYFRYGWDYHCAGTYTNVTTAEGKSEFVILTTAACLTYKETYKNLTLDHDYVVGCGETTEFVDNANNPLAPQRNARKVLIHPDWDPDTLENDIGIIFMKRQWTVSRDIMPIQLPDWDLEESDPLEGQVSGWGMRGTYHEIGKHLKWKWVVLPSDDFCMKQAEPPRKITGKQFCLDALTGFTGVATCKTDRGGPFAYFSSATDDWRLGGIISYQKGGNCKQLTQPTIMVRMSSYVDWIRTTVAAEIK